MVASFLSFGFSGLNEKKNPRKTLSPFPSSTLGIGNTRNALVIQIKMGTNSHFYNAKVDRLRFFYIEDGQGCHCPSSCLKPTSPASENRAAGLQRSMFRLRATQAPALPGGGRKQTHGARRDGQQPIRRQRPTRRPGTANHKTVPDAMACNSQSGGGTRRRPAANQKAERPFKLRARGAAGEWRGRGLGGSPGGAPAEAEVPVP